MQRTDAMDAAPPRPAPAPAAAVPGRRDGLPRWWAFIENHIILNVATILMVGAIGVMFYEASSRSLLSESHWWAEELVRFLVVWSVLLAIGVGTRHGHFIRMDLLYDMLPRRARMALAWLNCVIGLFFCGLLVVAGVQEVSHLHHIGMLTDSNLDLPLWLVRLILPLGGVLYGLAFLGNAVMLLRGVDPDQPAGGEQL
ncbi:TRAP transporter small permease [Azospirillum sp. RWY-5-1]|uniref:TRAP transporter small permease protein n=1 Tax=Azospirillum oleiclasticum TaxID=2735135 RepID=A0ABX2THA7_9PROT|nr:TRAP transporter small permease [Azospirillum oleiclasticum]NYZ16228.1 TRAP transporter small permease [Azospirillum oleiclasticum]NYZ23715.1 TRAP transporter small permease [Azospirillum oleiclasticum]